MDGIRAECGKYAKSEHIPIITIIYVTFNISVHNIVILIGIKRFQISETEK